MFRFIDMLLTIKSFWSEYLNVDYSKNDLSERRMI